MLKFGVNTYIWSAEFTRAQLPLLPRIKAGGFDGFEVAIFRPADFAAAEIRRGAEANGLEDTACSSASFAESLSYFARRYVMRSIASAFHSPSIKP